MISIIISTYNREQLLSRAIKSVLSQRCQEIELLVIDDGSKDKTREAVTRLEKGQSVSVRYIYKENGGCSSARNLGVSNARGEYIYFLDSDDEMTRDGLFQMYQALRSTNADYCFSPSIEAYRMGIKRINLPVSWKDPRFLARNHFFEPNVRVGTALYKRHIFEKIHSYRADLLFNEDSDFFQKVAICFSASYSSTPSVIVHHHANAKSRNRVEITRALLKSAESILTEYPEFRDSLGSKALRRITWLKAALIEDALLQKDFQRAMELRSSLGVDKDIFINLALQFHSSIPVAIKSILVQQPQKILRAMRSTRFF